AATTRRWPMAEVSSADILDGLRARAGIPIRLEGDGEFLHADGFAVLELLVCVLRGLAGDPARTSFAAGTEARGGEVWLTLSWTGPEAADGQVEAWLDAPLSQAYGAYSGRDALDGHRTEMWPETDGVRQRIVLPLEAASAPHLAPGEERPEFYDFDLAGAEVGRDLLDRPLAELSFVVFDTETTGLDPRGGDEIVQIAGMRIVNGRLLSGETFESLVNPGRRIPAGATAIHKIDDAMVADAPRIAEVGRDFHTFCRGAVLVAHNAPFDMAFLRRKEEAVGLPFDHPTLCTVLLSAALFQHSEKHTLDALAERFGIEIPAELRHTAMGDTVATAEVFLHMLGVMREEGIVTLGDALDAARQMTRIRAAQNY
ncbi:MAG: exonuclease domain-containing protein, partial [Pseudomonadota bacterium]